ncbi:hypothetical protein QG37_03182 [Candidozyma auris]|nr:hypothetical protein QG37_03182 [[Candida] auris]
MILKLTSGLLECGPLINNKFSIRKKKKKKKERHRIILFGILIVLMNPLL